MFLLTLHFLIAHTKHVLLTETFEKVINQDKTCPQTVYLYVLDNQLFGYGYVWMFFIHFYPFSSISICFSLVSIRFHSFLPVSIRFHPFPVVSIRFQSFPLVSIHFHSFIALVSSCFFCFVFFLLMFDNENGQPASFKNRHLYQKQ